MEVSREKQLVVVAVHWQLIRLFSCEAIGSPRKPGLSEAFGRPFTKLLKAFERLVRLAVGQGGLMVSKRDDRASK